MVSIFRTRRISTDARDWSTASLTKGEKKMFMDELSERQSLDTTTTTLSGLSTVDDSESDNASDMLSLKLRLLEQQLDEKDDTISGLRQALEREDERVTRLELQVGTLVELSSKEIVRQKAKKTKGSASSPSSSSKKTDAKHQDTETEAKLEISALQELLARVMAEKDRFQHHNNTLRGLLQKRNRPKCDTDRLAKSLDSCPSDIEDWGLEENSKKQEITKSKSQDALHERKLKRRPSREFSKDSSSKSMRNKNQDKPKRSPSRPEKTVQVTELNRDSIFTQNKVSYLYQMSCRNCTHSHCHIPYSSTFATDGDARKEMPKILKKHYRQVWRIVQLHRASADTASITSSVHEDEWLRSDSLNTFFPSSSFASHLAKHCSSLESEGDVLKYCMDCVKVEMQKNIR